MFATEWGGKSGRVLVTLLAVTLDEIRRSSRERAVENIITVLQEKISMSLLRSTVKISKDCKISTDKVVLKRMEEFYEVEK